MSAKPPLLRERGAGAEAVVVLVVPVVFGALTGFFLGESEPVYLVLSLLGVLGGLAAGLEHEYALEGLYRGLLGGLLFGTAILVTHGLRSVRATAELPDPSVLLIVLTAVGGALLGALGGFVRERLDRRAAARVRAAA